MPNPADSPLRSKSQGSRPSSKVLQVAKGLSATLGNDFFQSLIKHLATALDADCVYVGELATTPADRIRTIAIFRRDGGAEQFDRKVSGTAAGQVLTDGSFACSRDAGRLFPLDDLIASMDAQGYIGSRLSDSAGQPIGVLSMVSQKGFANIQLGKAVLEAFVPRAAAELERKRADDLHWQSEERCRAFISTNPDAMWRVEFAQPVPLNVSEEEQYDRIRRFGYLAECNDALARLAGLESCDQLVGTRFEEVAVRINPGAREELRAAIRSGFRGTTLETSPLDASGQPVYRLRSEFGVVEDGELRRIWGTTRDISDLRRAELSLAASERRFRDVLEGIQIPALMLNQEGQLTFANEYFLRLAQRSQEEMSSLTWLRGVFPEGEAETWKATMLADNRGRYPTVHFEGTIIPVDLKPRVIAWDTIALRDDDNQLAGLAAIGRDITRQRVLEREVRRAQILEGIGRLAAGISHDVNNLLTLILGHTEPLLEKTKSDDPARRHLSEIEQAAKECTQLTAQLLAFGRRQHLQPRLISLNELIIAEEGIIRSLIGGSIELVLELAAPLGLIYVDPTEIQRTIVNMVTNARDAMPQGGKLTIRTANVTIGEGEKGETALKPGAHVRLSISDTGVGMTEEVRNHIFEPFFTTKAPDKGTGLGLAVVYGIITQSSGHIEIHSEPGKGTKFDIWLPAARVLE